MRAYRLLTEEDTSAFCHKVSAALDGGWELFGNPAYAYDPKTGKMRCAQAVIKDVPGDYAPHLNLGEL
ncbi:DUF1737 domain-containing protein [Rhodovulum marinum]|uniref:DUF1737 domain-containing protein n=1 Tax=Rhodovulum marinum TaxID=320662 RepID=A0A4R2PV58_9RHOB|nr:DUF1737 domain-containing protein [Rhodovulum marinum]TCP39952.1 hypothetical protein EV662_10977 [Rhodovulum marinum]